jgi:hypothetical protein
MIQNQAPEVTQMTANKQLGLSGRKRIGFGQIVILNGVHRD